MCRASSSYATRWWALVAAGLAVAALCHALEQDDGTDNATDSCPPIPNCGIGYTCKVVKHPDNCPICKCVPCDDKPCVQKEGFGCTSIQMATGCRIATPVGCPVCDCPGTKGPFGTTAGNPEVESMPFDYQNDAENSFDP
ncbi:hypothetical protein MTO96_051656 [Rhipicephalus appendiculatus]